ncbi:MAG: hypothetical protein P8L77_03915 [Gammaproteobacteria bacterium]|nr:hypothetical protein [Gammaproteobacteria bacterium]
MKFGPSWQQPGYHWWCMPQIFTLIRRGVMGAHQTNVLNVCVKKNDIKKKTKI